MGRRLGKAGFTLVELLIVVAVIAILAAVAIPAYSAQLEGAREAVDSTNLRNAKSLAYADYLGKWAANDPTIPASGTLKYYYLNVGVDSGQVAVPSPLSGSTPNHVAPQAKANDGAHIEVVIADGGVVVSADWVS